MIWCGVLEDVNQTISDKIFNNVCDYLYKKGVHKAKQPRNFTRLRNTARTLTILNALNIVFNHTPRYKNRTFYLKQIRDVEPYLVVTEEIAYFTLTLSEAVFINPILPYVVEVIALNLCHCGAGQEPNYYLNPLTEETDYDYVCFEATSVEAAAHNIHKYMTKVKASPNNIVLLLRELWNTTYDFVPRDGHGHCKTTLVNGDEIQIDPIPMSILKKEGAGGKHIMMSKAFIEMVGKDKQVMHEAIKETFHCKIRPRRILTGETYLRDTNEPQYLKTLEIKPGPNYFSFINTNHTNSIENMVYTGFHSVEKPFYFVDDDFERLVFQKHWMNCGFPRDQMEKLMKNFLPQEVEKAIQKNNTYSHTMNKKYPNDYQKENKICTAEIRNLQTNQKEKVRKGTYNFSNLLRKKRKFS